GQTVGHIMQATQRTWPSSRSMRRCNPRNRSGYAFFSSGYSMVAMSLFLRWPVTFKKKFFMKWRKVTPSPSAIAGTNNCWLKLPGRLTTLTPMAIALAPLRPKNDERRRDHVDDRDRQQALPAEPHQLVGAEARQRPANQQLEHAEGEDLHRPQPEHHQHEQRVGQVRGQEAVDQRAPVPAAEEQRDH